MKIWEDGMNMLRLKKKKGLHENQRRGYEHAMNKGSNFAYTHTWYFF